MSRYYIVNTPNGKLAWIGSLKPDGFGVVWLVTPEPDGKALWRVAEDSVTETTPETLAQLLGAK